MAAHASAQAPRSWGLRARLKAFASRLELDARLAAGEPPSSCPELARRAERLCGARVRHRLADSLDRVVDEAGGPSRELTAAVPVQREEVLSAARDLRRLAAALRARPAAPVCAAATASLLLSDGSGPVFAPHPHGTLREIAFQAAFHAEAD
jgi:hypothetical protein